MVSFYRCRRLRSHSRRVDVVFVRNIYDLLNSDMNSSMENLYQFTN